MDRLQDDLLEDPVIKERDAERLAQLCDHTHKCEMSFQLWDKGYMINSKKLMTKFFQRPPYKINTEFVTIDNRGKSGGTFTDLRLLVENVASAADSHYGHLS